MSELAHQGNFQLSHLYACTQSFRPLQAHLKISQQIQALKGGVLCQNDEKISPTFSPYGFYENPVSTTGLLQLRFRISKFFQDLKLLLT